MKDRVGDPPRDIPVAVISMRGLLILVAFVGTVAGGLSGWALWGAGTLLTPASPTATASPVPAARPDSSVVGDTASASGEPLDVSMDVSSAARGEPIAGAPTDAPQLPTPNSAARTPATRPGAVCLYDEAKGVVVDFLDAYNRADEAAMARFFGPKFRWYSATNRMGGEPHFVAHRSVDALTYLHSRVMKGERLTLSEFHVTDPSGAPPRDLVNFWYRLDRTLAGTSFMGMGKGALDCDAREIFVWSAGDITP